MRVLLLTLSDLLPVALNSVLNPANEYCAIVVDMPEPARNFLKQNGYSENLVQPFDDLKEVFVDYHYDVIFAIVNSWVDSFLMKYLEEYGLPENKLIHVCLASNEPDFFFIERALRYYGEHAEEYDMIATGLSYTRHGLDANRFKFKLLNLAKAGNDLYYDYRIAENIMNRGGGRKDTLCSDWSCAM